MVTSGALFAYAIAWKPGHSGGVTIWAAIALVLACTAGGVEETSSGNVAASFFDRSILSVRSSVPDTGSAALGSGSVRVTPGRLPAEVGIVRS